LIVPGLLAFVLLSLSLVTSSLLASGAAASFGFDAASF